MLGVNDFSDSSYEKNLPECQNWQKWHKDFWHEGQISNASPNAINLTLALKLSLCHKIGNKEFWDIPSQQCHIKCRLYEIGIQKNANAKIESDCFLIQSENYTGIKMAFKTK